MTYFVAETGTAPFTVAAMLLMSATSCASRLMLRPLAPATAPASSIALITTPSTANPEVGSVIKVLDVKRGYRRLIGAGYAPKKRYHPKDQAAV